LPQTARAFADVPTAIVEQLFLTATSFPSSRSSIFAPSPRCILDSSLDACSVLVGFNGELLIDFPLFTVDLNNVVDGDNFVSNGVVHVIDGVLVPSWVFNSLTDRVFANDDLSTLFSLPCCEIDCLDLPHLRSWLTNDAFALLDTATIDFLTSTDGLADLTAILQYHVLLGISTSMFFRRGSHRLWRAVWW
jgi:hypothetical protein